MAGRRHRRAGHRGVFQTDLKPQLERIHGQVQLVGNLQRIVLTAVWQDDHKLFATLPMQVPICCYCQMSDG